MFRFKTIALVGGTGLALLAAQSAPALQLDFSSLTMAGISFNGTGNFVFVPSLGNEFRIDSSDGTGDSVGDMGRMDGTWTIGPISSPTAGEFEAPVTGTGTLTISDGSKNLTGNLTWNLIETKGTGGALNVAGVLNLSGLSYSGTQADLLQLATLQGGNAQENLQFSTSTLTGGQVTLVDLVSGTALQSSFSGKFIALPQVRVPDGGSSLFLLGSALLCLGGLRRRFGQ